jgi:HEAT repeat protein
MNSGRWANASRLKTVTGLPAGLTSCLTTGLAALLMATAGCQSGSGNSDPAQRGNGSPNAGASTANTSDTTTAVNRSAMRERAIAELLEASSSNSAQLRANAIEGLALSPARLGPSLAAALRDENEGVRAVAAVIVGKTSQRSQLAAVRSMVRDSSPFVQASAIYAARALGDTSIDPTIVGTFATTHPSPRVRAHAVSMLGLMGDPSAIPVLRAAATARLVRASEGETRLLRLSASESMARLGVDEEIHTLHAALFPSTPDQLEVAAVAAQMLGELGSRRSMPELINLVVYEDSSTSQRMPAEIRMAAARSLGQLGKRDGAFVALEYVNHTNPMLRAQAARTLGVMQGSEVLPTLQRLLEDPDPSVRVAAAAGALEALDGR